MVIVAVCATYGRLGFGLRFDRGIAIAIAIARDRDRDRDPLTHILGKQKWTSLPSPPPPTPSRGSHRHIGSSTCGSLIRHTIYMWNWEVSKPKVSSRKLVGSRVKHRSAGAGREREGIGGLSNDPVRPLTHGPLGIWEGFAAAVVTERCCCLCCLRI